MTKIYFYILILFFLSSCSYKVHRFDEVYKISKKGTNFYIIQEKNQYLMIDCGTPKHGKKIAEVLLKNDIDPKLIKYLILTHAHYDHAGNAHYFQQQFGTKIIVGKGDLNMVKNKGKDIMLCPTSFTSKIGKPFIKNITYPVFKPNIILDKNFDLNQIGFTGQIILLPGHTKGSLIVSSNSNVFVGDLIRGNLLNNTKPEKHFYMCDLQNNDIDIQQVTKLNKTWYLGHYGPIQNYEILKFLKSN